MKLPQFDRLTLIPAGCLVLLGFAGCASSRNQSTADNHPQDTSLGSSAYRRAAPQGKPGYAQEPSYSRDEYPDFRGKRTPYATGEGAGETELLETPRFPVEEESTGADSADRRSFRESLHLKVAGLWNRRASSGKSNETVARAPVAAGAAASSWNVRITDNQVARRETDNTLPDEGEITDTGLVNLDAPLDRKTGPQIFQERQAALRRIPMGGRQVASSAKMGLEEPALRPVRGTSEQPPEWADRRPSVPTGIAVSETRILSSSPSQITSNVEPDGSSLGSSTLDSVTPEILTPGAEPVRMVDPPHLSVPPSGPNAKAGPEATAAFAVSRMVLCRQVHGYDDVVEIQSQQLQRGQPILVYAALDNFLSIATAKGYRTLTLSTLEIQSSDGDVVLRMRLGTAIDLSEVPRQDFFLTHRVTIPENLPAGDYIFDLRIDDLQAHESSRSQLAVTVTADRSRPDGTGDTSKFATRPDSFQR